MRPGWYSNPEDPQNVAFFDGNSFTQPMHISVLTPEQADTVRAYTGASMPVPATAVPKAKTEQTPALNFGPLTAAKLDNPGRRFRRKVYIGLACLIGISILINLGAPSAEKQAADAVSASCMTAMNELGAKVDEMYAAEANGTTFSPAAWNRIEKPSLEACASAEEWIAAAKANPLAVDVTHEDGVDETLLWSRCTSAPGKGTRVCKDAEAKGLLTP